MAGCISQQSAPCSFTVLTELKFLHEYATQLATLINLTSRGWGQIDAIFIKYFIKAAINQSSGV